MEEVIQDEGKSYKMLLNYKYRGLVSSLELKRKYFCQNDEWNNLGFWKKLNLYNLTVKM